jgi:AcrR family transcriptional regulator
MAIYIPFKKPLDNDERSEYKLNMFNVEKARGKSEETRERILQIALGAFRVRGFVATTMREVAAEAQMALGAAYYYFPGKDAIIQAYYEGVQAEHERRVTAALAGKDFDLTARLRIAMHAKLDILQNDRKILRAIFRYAGEPNHPLCMLGPGTLELRRRSIAIFAQAVGEESLPADIRKVLPTALWALHMGMLLYFIYDESDSQTRTRRLLDGALDLAVRMLALVKFPLLKPLRGSLIQLLHDAGLLPESSSPSVFSPKEERI